MFHPSLRGRKASRPSREFDPRVHGPVREGEGPGVHCFIPSSPSPPIPTPVSRALPQPVRCGVLSVVALMAPRRSDPFPRGPLCMPSRRVPRPGEGRPRCTGACARPEQPMHQPFMARWAVTTVATTEDAVILARARGFIPVSAGRARRQPRQHQGQPHRCLGPRVLGERPPPIIVGELVPEGGYFVMVMLSDDAPELDDVRRTGRRRPRRGRAHVRGYERRRDAVDTRSTSAPRAPSNRAASPRSNARRASPARARAVTPRRPRAMTFRGEAEVADPPSSGGGSMVSSVRRP